MGVAGLGQSIGVSGIGFRVQRGSGRAGLGLRIGVLSSTPSQLHNLKQLGHQVRCSGS